ncbi:MAG: TetR/AcrR family transcriptional regulator [Gomphosphaeria aponina SAG 52.96 = DSM 107014]|uniref:TetR/AcrR family transcriptional regulator n=1 Tax=Gomphosphaeria aponina SAG 52.96 = DSM 107014 TaxID=1521640 RepID=A0A941GWF5_9CHRO|nr:TetR/AcrR family transcriptional regulator [Gomphosphaeria aponina SAG 52.96 = DSM 107014]
MSKTQKQQHLDKAEQILAGALPEFLQHGYARTSMDRIASAAGVSKQTLYTHFGDKDGLFNAILKQMAREKFQLVCSKPLEGEPEQVLRDLAQRLLKEVNDPDHLAFVRLIVAESVNHPESPKLFLIHVVQPALKILTEYLEQHQKLKDCEAIARIFVGALIHHIITQEILHGKEIIPIEEERIVDNLIKLIVH